jgi:hypothetical protein
VLHKKASLLLTFLAIAVMAVPVAAGFGDPLVTNGSPTSPFSQNKQNEPWIAVDPSDPSVLAAGANEEIDMEACASGDPTTCPFTNGVGVSGIYFSFDGGASWTQPTYQGYSARNCLGPAECVPDPAGQIGTLPWYYENGLVSDGDPSLAFGPRPDENGDFSWSNGSRLYYANLTSNFSDTRDELAFKGYEAIAVSRSDDVAAAAANDMNAWMPPVLVSKQSSTTFSDKEAITVDNAASSPYFGNVYVCNVAFRSLGGPPQPVVVIRSSDGGDTWTQQQISQAANTNQGTGQAGGRQGCVIRTDSQGVVYVVWRGSYMGNDVVWMSRSYNGGQRFDKAQPVAVTGTVGDYDPVQRRLTFDGVAGARTNEGPSLDIANGAPTGTGAPDTLLLSWTDGQNGLNSERAMVQYSTDGGENWSQPFDATDGSDRPDFVWAAISPNGQDVYLTYMGFLDPWRDSLSDTRQMQGVVRHADFSDLATWTTLLRGGIGDARGSSANGLSSEFLGDYDFVVATNDFASAVWNDVRDAAICPAINSYRQSLVDGSPIAPPDVQSDCPANFGNSDIYGNSFADPTP